MKSLSTYSYKEIISNYRMSASVNCYKSDFYSQMENGERKCEYFIKKYLPYWLRFGNMNCM